MFSRKKSSGAKPGKAPGLSFIGPEVTVSGNVATSAQLHVDGKVEGDVACDSLCQGEGGEIRGNIGAGHARIAGLVDGKVTARTLVLEATARVTGDVVYETISIAAGAQVDGRLARREQPADAKVAKIESAKAEPAERPAGELFTGTQPPQAAAAG